MLGNSQKDRKGWFQSRKELKGSMTEELGRLKQTAITRREQSKQQSLIQRGQLFKQMCFSGKAFFITEVFCKREYYFIKWFLVWRLLWGDCRACGFFKARRAMNKWSGRVGGRIMSSLFFWSYWLEQRKCWAFLSCTHIWITDTNLYSLHINTWKFISWWLENT